MICSHLAPVGPARTCLALPALAVALLALGACNGSQTAGGGNVSMRDVEVVDGTANDMMADLDNATGDGTLLSNAGGLPGAMPMPGSSASGNAAVDSLAANSSEAAPREKSANASAPE